MKWPTHQTITGYREYVETVHTLITRGEVIRDGWRARFDDPGKVKTRRIVIRAVDNRIEVQSVADIVIGTGSVGLIRDDDVSIEPKACPMLWDLLNDGYIKIGMVGIRSKDPKPVMVVDNAGDHIRIRCVGTILKIDYPYWRNDPDIHEFRVYADRMVVDNGGPDIHVNFD